MNPDGTIPILRISVILDSTGEYNIGVENAQAVEEQIWALLMNWA